MLEIENVEEAIENSQKIIPPEVADEMENFDIFKFFEERGANEGK